MEEKIITRRNFLRMTAGTAITVSLGGGILGESRAEPTAKVVLIRNAEVLGPQDKVQGGILQSMLDEAVKSLLGTNEPLEAWKKLFKSSD
ncbi:MAG: twin-arginine translocation signal domain-containing protein, partial [Desulfobacterales bacterium]|nr:twin-arginine translocation signal domain-containing protein [Desulfobacterales bacterium]